jgi:hypothetical protein
MPDFGHKAAFNDNWGLAAINLKAVAQRANSAYAWSVAVSCLNRSGFSGGR